MPTDQISRPTAAANGTRSTAELQITGSTPTTDQTPVVTLTLAIGETLDISVHPDPEGRDMRARWDRVKWLHYSYLADGVSDVLGDVLGISRESVTVNGSLLCSETTAKPRLLVEVPAEYKERALGEDVQGAIRRLVGRVMGVIPESAGQEAAVATSTGRAVVQADEGAVPLDASAFQSNVSVLHDMKVDAAARRLLSKVGGATLPVRCSIAMVGASDSVAEVVGRCADKPKPPSLPPEEVPLSCFVDGFSRSRHLLFLVECDKSGLACEVAMPVEWIERVAEYAQRGSARFIARLRIVKSGSTTRRELLDLQMAGLLGQDASDQKGMGS